MTPIKRQLIVFSCLILLGLTGLALFMNAIHNKSIEINNNWLPSIQHVSTINTLTSDFRINELEHILSVSEDQMRSYENNMQRINEAIREEMKGYEPLITTVNEKRLYADFVSKWNDYLNQHQLMISLSKENKNEDAKALIRARSEALFHEFSASLTLLAAENRMLAQQETDAGKQLLILTAINLVLILGLLIYFVYRTAQHMKTMFEKLVNRWVSVMTDIYV